MTLGQSLSAGAAGASLLHIERARNGTGSWAAVNTSLMAAVAEGTSITPNANLFFGAPALAFVLHEAAGRPGIGHALATLDAGTATVTRRRLEAAHRRLDHGDQPHFAEYDLLRGLTGIGVVLRRRRNTHLLRQVLLYLVRLTEPLGQLPGWWCPTGPNRNRTGPVGGHGNNGIAHGITGPLALLALALRDGIKVDGHTEAITRICCWLDAWEQRSDSGTRWPEIVTLDDIDQGVTRQTGPLRPSWCYGTPGIARTMQLTGLALHDPDRQRRAEAVFIDCVNDPHQLARLIDRSQCHGTGGILTTARRIADDSVIPIPVEKLLRLHQQAEAPTDEPPGYLEGTVGADLALAGTTTSWDASLLLC
jgi:hypothetical protein